MRRDDDGSTSGPCPHCGADVFELPNVHDPKGAPLVLDLVPVTRVVPCDAVGGCHPAGEYGRKLRTFAEHVCQHTTQKEETP